MLKRFACLPRWVKPYLLPLFLLLSTTAFPQQKIVVNGIVITENNVPLAGVTVNVKGSSAGTVTDTTGKFHIEVGRGISLVFSFVGYGGKEIKATRENLGSIQMVSAAAALGEVVVIGYGTQSKKKVSSSISEVNTAELKDLPIQTTGQLLEGRASGLTVNQNTGAPGSPPSILIHGISSVNAGIGPLVVIDGFPVGNDIPTSLNPGDVEKITVLKDAASTSIYGARGSNGVILIQTTRAKVSHSEIDYNVSGGYQYVPESWRPKMLNAQQYAEYNKEIVDETNAHNNTTTPVPQIFLDALSNPGKYGNGTNWMDKFFRQGADASLQDHNLSFRAGNNQVTGVITAGYLNQDGVLPNSSFRRYSIRTNVEGNFTKWLKAAANVSMARTENNQLPESGSRGLLMAAIVASPLQSPYDQNGKIIPYLPADAPGYFSYTNPLYQASVVKDNIIGRDINAGMNLDIEIVKGLHFKPQVYSRLYTQQENTFVPTTVGIFAIGTAANLSPGAPPYVNTATNQNYDITNWGVDNLLTYDKTIGYHSINILAGYTAQKQTGSLSQINASNFPTNTNLNYLDASQISASVSDYTNWSLAAFFGRINYDYKGKYLADLNFRREGSSRFGSNNKYGNFPAASVGWRISQEEFYPNDFFMNELKVRASYGKTGNSAIGDFDRFGKIISIPDLTNLSNNYNYVLNGSSIVTGRALTSLGDENLKWEIATQLDIGLNVAFLHDHITFKADYYKKTTDDMLFNVTVPLASGFSSTRVNIGNMVNKGWDFEAGANLGSKNFKWSSNLNLSFLQNEVTSMPAQISKIVSTYNITQVGKPVGSLYGYQIDGIFNTQDQLTNPKLIGWPGAKSLGAYIYRDINGDGKIDALDQTVIGNPHPKVVLGFNNTFVYKNLTLSVLTTGAFGYQVLPEINEVVYNEKQRWNVSDKFLNRWKSPANPGAGLIPEVYYAGQHNASNIWVENGDHVWIKNITLGYKIPASLMNSIKFISSLRFYASVQNAFKFTNYTGWNPEVSYFGGANATTFGIDNFSYPIARTYTLGANITL
jgi:TonB-linked SusC/RagA family outer membrane protein